MVILIIQRRRSRRLNLILVHLPTHLENSSYKLLKRICLKKIFYYLSVFVFSILICFQFLSAILVTNLMIEDFPKKALSMDLDLARPPGCSWSWTISDYGDGYFEVLGVWGDSAFTKKRKINDSFVAPETYDEFVTFLDKEMKKQNKKSSSDKQESYELSIRRTKKTIRQKALMLKVDRLITCTTRASIRDIEVFRDITTRFFRDCRKRLDKFEYIAVFERHKSEKTSAGKYGSLHLHLATKGFVQYNLLRQMWRKAVNSVLKNDDFEGANVNVMRTNQNSGSRAIVHRERIARYLSKYISKDITDDYESGKRRYWASRGIEKPITYKVYTTTSTTNDTYRTIFRELIGVPIKKVFKPAMRNDGVSLVPPIVWLST